MKKNLKSWDYVPPIGQCITEPSLTVPRGQSYTVRELLARYTTGTMPSVMRNVEYDEDPDYLVDNLPEPPVDMVDVQEHYDAVNQRIAKNKRRKTELEFRKHAEGLERSESFSAGPKNERSERSEDKI